TRGAAHEGDAVAHRRSPAHDRFAVADAGGAAREGDAVAHAEHAGDPVAHARGASPEGVAVARARVATRAGLDRQDRADPTHRPTPEAADRVARETERDARHRTAQGAANGEEASPSAR